MLHYTNLIISETIGEMGRFTWTSTGVSECLRSRNVLHNMKLSVWRESFEKEEMYSEKHFSGCQCLEVGADWTDWREGNSNSNNHLLQPGYAEEHMG